MCTKQVSCATHPIRNPALGCEVSIRERVAMMSAADWDMCVDAVLNEQETVTQARHAALVDFQRVTAW